MDTPEPRLKILFFNNYLSSALCLLPGRPVQVKRLLLPVPPLAGWPSNNRAVWGNTCPQLLLFFP